MINRPMNRQDSDSPPPAPGPALPPPPALPREFKHSHGPGLPGGRRYALVAHEAELAFHNFQTRFVKIPFKQKGGHCAGCCGLFVAMRLSGLTAETALKNFTPDFAAALVANMQNAYWDRIEATQEARISHNVSHLLTMAYEKTRLRLNNRINTLKKNTILFTRPIGILDPARHAFPEPLLSLSLKKGSNRVSRDDSNVDFNRNPSLGMRQALFEYYKAPAGQPPMWMPARGQGNSSSSSSNATSSPSQPATPGSARPTPFVFLGLRYRNKFGKPTGHAVLVDLSDPQNPCLFDPNFGWLEARQGNCSLGFERMLYESWRHYAKLNSTNGMGGVQNLEVRKDKEYYILAMQIYEQPAGN